MFNFCRSDNLGPASKDDEPIAVRLNKSRSLDYAFTPLAFGLIGLGIDALLGTLPWFTAGLVLFSVVGLGVRGYYAYVKEMDEHAKALPFGSSKVRAEQPQ